MKLDEVLFVIDGDPKPLARPRFGARRVWDSQKKLKHDIQLILQSQKKYKGFLSKALHMEVTFFMKTPLKSRREGQFHIYRPDLDNMIKMVGDVCGQILYKEDCIIASIAAKKIYDLHPRTEFYLKEIC